MKQIMGAAIDKRVAQCRMTSKRLIGRKRNMKSPGGDNKKDLNDIVVVGLAESIRRAEEVMALREQISANAAINSGAEFGHLFDRLQSMLGQYAILLVTRIFEPEEDGFQSTSIPVALNNMRFNADYLEIHDRDFVLKKLISFGHEEKEFEGIPTPWITQLVRKEFADRLPDLKDPDANDLSRALYNLKQMRDVSASDSATGQEGLNIEESDRSIKTLLMYARDFVDTIGRGYLGVNLEIDTKTIESQLKQLFQQAGISS